MDPTAATVQRSTSPFLKGYAAALGIYDEMRTDQGELRAHWARFVSSLEKLGGSETASRWESGRRLLREHGVTYNVYGDPEGMQRPWALDLAPLLIPADEWNRVEAGLIQRTRLFNLILADLYGGGQQLLRDGFLAPELVYANPGFLRPCRGIPTAKNIYLHLHGCELGRSVNGTWWALADRTQAPSGTGYALENRTVISRILPETIREHDVRRLAPFFRAQREMLFGLAPKGKEHPSVVLLTPGPHNETYFEHAYLARHLGFPLVEGADLTVRDQRVFLKTLEGLQQIDVILRRVDDSFCDPLELRGESFLGIAGLVEATRAGTVTVANALGAGFMESPGLLAFLPGLCRHLLDEDLILPSVATWWCGQSDELRYVLDHLDTLVIKPALGGANRQPWFGGRLSRAERSDLVAMIHARPREFIGQERVTLSRTPVWCENHFEARAVVLRAYVANGGDSFAVLPGGLTRTSATAEDPVVSMQSGGGSKDTWILGASDYDPAEPNASDVTAPAANRLLSSVPSRAADNLFWLGRYTERLEQTLRTLRCVLGRLSDESARDDSPTLKALSELLHHLELIPAPIRGEPDNGGLQSKVLRLVYEPEIEGSVPDLLSRVRSIASTVRDRFSGDTWRILGRLDADARSRAGRLPLAGALAMIHNLVLDLAAFSGMEMENMTRGHGWRFLDSGRRLERAVSVVDLVHAAVRVQSHRAEVLEPVLEIADSVMTYRRQHYSEARLPGLIELLLQDDSNPRSLAFQLQVLSQHAQDFPQPQGSWTENETEARLSLLSAVAKRTGIEAHGCSSAGENSAILEQTLREISDGLHAFGDDLTHYYFSHTLPRVS